MTSNPFHLALDMAGGGELADLFAAKRNQDRVILDIARECASYTLPHVMPKEYQETDEYLEQNFQSEGSRGANNVVGRLLLATVPPGEKYFEQRLSLAVQYADDVSPEVKAAMRMALHANTLIMHDALEGSMMGIVGSSFHERIRQLLTNVVVTGHGLARFNPDATLRIYNREQFVLWRDSNGNLLRAAVMEVVDPRDLSEEDRDRAKIDDKKLKEKLETRMMGLFTVWEGGEERQEVNGKLIRDMANTVNPLIDLPYNLVAGEDYGRGLAEENLGDLRSLDGLCKARNDFLAASSRVVPVLDRNSQILEEDLTRPNLEVIRGEVDSAGNVGGVGFLQSRSAPDYSMLSDGINQLQRSLGKAFLLSSEVQPTGDRVTAAAINDIREELNGSLGVVYANIADTLQSALALNIEDYCNRKGMLVDMPEGSYEIKLNVGLKRLAERDKAARALTIVNELRNVPALAQRIKDGGFLSMLMATLNMNTDELVKSDEEVQAEQARASVAQTQQVAQDTAAQEAVSIAGDAVREEISE